MSPPSGTTDAVPPDRRGRLKSLTGLRFLAALHVLLFHAAGTFPGATLFALPAPLSNWIQSGYVGVSLFFILSGFILAYNYLDSDLADPSERRAFWISRFARVYPIYLIGLLVAAPKFLLGVAQGGTTEGIAEASLLGAAVLTLTQAWAPGSALAWNAPGWSLSAEAFFYLVFPLLALRLRHLGKRGASLCMLGCWIVALLPPSLYYWLAPDSSVWANVVKFNPLIRLPEFLVGLCLGRLFLLRPSGARSPISSPGWAATLILATLLLQNRLPKLFVHNALMVPLFAWLIFSLATNHANRLSRFLATPGLILMGEASYALYILHVPIKGLFMFAVQKAGNPSGPWIESALFAAYLTVTLLAAFAAFKLVEVPARHWIRQRFTATGSAVAADGCLSNPVRTPTS